MHVKMRLNADVPYFELIFIILRTGRHCCRSRIFIIKELKERHLHTGREGYVTKGSSAEANNENGPAKDFIPTIRITEEIFMHGPRVLMEQLVTLI